MDKKIKALDELKVGDTVVMYGLIEYDRFDHENVLRPDSIATVKKVPRRDTAEEKRVELHMHSNMSAMDGMTPADKLVPPRLRVRATRRSRSPTTGWCRRSPTR